VPSSHRTSVLRHVDQQIDVAVRTLFAPRNRTEKAKVGRTMTGRDGGKHIALAVQSVS
jgi:hypothetical protein